MVIASHREPFAAKQHQLARCFFSNIEIGDRPRDGPERFVHRYGEFIHAVIHAGRAPRMHAEETCRIDDKKRVARNGVFRSVDGENKTVDRKAALLCKRDEVTPEAE